FTAYNDGLRSGFISFMQTFVFSLSLMILMPMAFGLTGVWVAFPLAEALTIVLSTLFIIKLGKKYKYIKSKD
ncbi:MAG: MATE family efflux transporter, partial [Firmicutes bacterium]|nr:MATE family efflux transporter [Bacillota bacterium]